MSVHDFTSEEGIRTYLTQKHGETPRSVKLLTGGTANYVYSIVPSGGFAQVLKHAAPYLQSSKTFAFDPARMDYEARILERVVDLQDPKDKAHAVQLFTYDSDNKLLAMEDGGLSNLKTAYGNEKLNVPEVGQRLAAWLSTLHTRSIDTYLAKDPTEKGNNPIAVAIYRHSYNNLHTALTKFDYDVTIAHRINERFGSLLASDNECICHGDFWPGNVCVRPNSMSVSTAHSADNFSDVNLIIVDWEMSRRGTSATDVGQFAAEAFLLDRFRGNRGLRAAFLAAYLARREEAASSVRIDRKWAVRMAVHWAVHVAFWPTRVEWTDEEGTRQLVEIGVEVLQAALYEDWMTILAAPLFDGVRQEWEGVFSRG